MYFLRYHDFFDFRNGCSLTFGFLKFQNCICCVAQRTEMHNHAKSWQNWSTLCRDNAPFQFFRVTATRHLAFPRIECFCPVVSRKPICISKTNFIKIGQEIYDISHFLFFTAIVNLKILKFYCMTMSGGDERLRHATFC